MTNISANGIDIEYEEFGNPSDPVLLLIIGFGLQLTGWPVAFCRNMADKGYRVIRFDSRDTGLSQKFADHGMADLADAAAKQAQGLAVHAPYTEDDMADDTAALLTAIGIDKAHVVGMSMGGRIAQRMALRHPDRIRGLVLMMTYSGAPDVPEGDPAVRQELFAAPEDPSDANSVADLGMRIYDLIRGPRFDYDSEARRRRILDDIERSPDLLGYGRNLLAGMAAPPIHEKLSNMTSPTLVLHGDSDPLFPVGVAEDLRDRISGARLSLIEGMGHEVFAPDLGELLAEAIAGHCDGL